MQTRKQSLCESHVNTGLGFIGSYLITYLFIKYAKLDPFWMANVTVAACTLWSLIRGYYVRRYFNGLQADKSSPSVSCASGSAGGVEENLRAANKSIDQMLGRKSKF